MRKGRKKEGKIDSYFERGNSQSASHPVFLGVLTKVVSVQHKTHRSSPHPSPPTEEINNSPFSPLFGSGCCKTVYKNTFSYWQTNTHSH